MSEGRLAGPNESRQWFMDEVHGLSRSKDGQDSDQGKGIRGQDRHP